MEYTMDREEIVNKLKQGLLEVTFNKVNGDERVMTCTLQEGVIPAATKVDPLSLKKIRNGPFKRNIGPIWSISTPL